MRNRLLKVSSGSRALRFKCHEMSNEAAQSGESVNPDKMETAAKVFFSAPRYAITGASANPLKFGNKCFFLLSDPRNLGLTMRSDGMVRCAESVHNSGEPFVHVNQRRRNTLPSRLIGSTAFVAD